MTEQSDLDWRRLGEMVRDARIRRGYRTQRALAAAMGVSSKLINNIELGKNTSYSPSSLIALETALGWGRGSVEHVLGGGDPSHTEAPTPLYDWQRLANHVRLRREEAGLSQAEAAIRGGLSEDTLARVEVGQRVRHQLVLSALDQAMAWFQGSSQRVLNGGDPHPHPGLPRALSRDQALERKVLSSLRPARRLSDLTYDDLFDRWARLFAQSLGIETEYARRRALSGPGEARDELYEVLVMSDQGREGRPWVPPWEEISDEEAQEHIDSLREAGLIDEHGQPIEQEDDAPPHPIPEPELDDGYLRDLGAAAREGDDSEPGPSDPDDKVDPDQ